MKVVTDQNGKVVLTNNKALGVTISEGNPNAVLYIPQTLTPIQQQQARTNIGATESEIFWAEYGTTTAAEIDAAISSNKTVLCRYNNQEYSLVHYNTTDDYIYFGASYVTNAIWLRVQRSNDAWVSGLQGLESVTNKVTTLSSQSTDTQYPSAKAVYDKLSEVPVSSVVSSKVNHIIPINPGHNGTAFGASTTQEIRFGDDGNVDILTSNYGKLRLNYSEVALASDIPDVSSFITKSVNDLVNYYTTNDTYNKTQMNQMISAIKSFEYVLETELPTASADTMYKIYLIPSADPQASNIKDEYITIDYGNAPRPYGLPRFDWEQIGSTAIDLSGYVTTTELNTALASYVTSTALTTALAAKQDVIDDLANIRSGASAGASAYQKPSTGIPATDLASGVQTAVENATVTGKIFRGTCSTAASTAAKVVTCPDFTSADLVKGAAILVTFSATNTATAADLTMNVNSTGAKNLRKIYNATTRATLNSAGELRIDQTYLFVYDGTAWVCLTLNYNSTYSTMTQSQANTGTATTGYLIPPKVLADTITNRIANKADKATTLGGYGITDAYTIEQVNGLVDSVFKPAGSAATVAALGALTSANVGKVYNMSAAFTTTSDFVEGAGLAYPAGTNVVIVEASNGVYKYDVFSGIVDLSGKQDVISDLTTIRSGAAAGATAVQPATLETALANKQDVIDANHKLDYSLIDNTPSIPSKTSDLTNDSGFITGYTETDPTVPAWAKTANKPSYNYSEIGNTPTIPSKTSDLTNDSGFITSADVPEGSTASTTLPLMDGTAAVGTETAFARGDHVHPSDTSKQDVIDSSHKLPYSLLSGTPTIPDELADLQDDATHRLVTDTEKSTWNGKSDFSGDYDDLTNKPTIPAAPGTLNTNNTTGQSANSSESLSGTIKLHKVSKTGSYNDLLNKPTIPIVPKISTNISTDASSDTMTASPRAVKTYVDNICGDIETLLAAI